MRVNHLRLQIRHRVAGPVDQIIRQSFIRINYVFRIQQTDIEQQIVSVADFMWKLNLLG